jgi:capsular polysaccharide export protein
MQRARAGIQLLTRCQISKYNHLPAVPPSALYGAKSSKRVLILGQVEGDMSLALGGAAHLNDADLIDLAVRENPEAQIIYKPHPETLVGQRHQRVLGAEQLSKVVVLRKAVSLPSCLETVDHVYTNTSLAGFEALFRGIKVTCVGMPFYAGWGVTDDRQSCSRRTCKRTVEEIFAAAYLLYPKYVDLETRHTIAFERAAFCLAHEEIGSGTRALES